MESRLKTYELWIRRLWSIVYGLGSANEFMHMLIHENFKKFLHIEMLVKRCNFENSKSNGSQLKNPDISGAIFTLNLNLLILNSQGVEGASDQPETLGSTVIPSNIFIWSIYDMDQSILYGPYHMIRFIWIFSTYPCRLFQQQQTFQLSRFYILIKSPMLVIWKFLFDWRNGQFFHRDGHRADVVEHSVHLHLILLN